jgi:hypothetical protein
MNFLHERDLGDIILSLASVQAAGGGNYYIQNNPNAIRMLAPLIEHQPYINKCGKKLLYQIDKSFVDFRNGGLPYGVPLAELHARWIKQHTDLNKQWLFCPKDNKFKGRIIVNKTNRYANPLFPWKEIVNQLGELILFVGHDNEYDLFCRRFGKVERLIVKDYLELAIAINSSECFIGNQSSANCVAEGLKHRTIQEVCLWTPDCIYKRDNATFCYDGNIDTVLSGKRIQVSDKTPERYIDKSHTPSGGWRLTINGKKINSYSIDVLVIQAQSAGMEKPKSEIEKMIVAETLPFVALDPITERLLVSIQKVKELIG